MTATDLPIKPYADRCFNNALSFDRILDSSFTDIDWHAPWLSHLNQLALIGDAVKNLSGSNEQKNQITHDDQPIDIIASLLNEALKSQVTSPTTKPIHAQQAQILRFVSQNALPEGEAYESFIATTGNIPTRDNLHDLFNGSIWLTFPKTKAVLNYHHMIEIAEQGIRESRGRVRDTITIFDENGAVLVTSNIRVSDALIDFDWQASLVKPRAQWDNPKQTNPHAEAAVYIFGHALLEQLVQPRKPLCAHSIIVTVTPDFFTLSPSERMRYLDNKVAQYMHELLLKDDVTPRQFAPLPILGVPYFWAENENPHFYEDNYVFRHGRRQKNNV
ncbi:DUF3025 domain-containing protein [Psychrobacter immobilis]|uniref:DUF3025 domain-containing protein n=1 Tax=Psychrobacter immobilis TaxID=498 RepID=UPI00191A0836|nr:DUF3025 domain-containing protein [Psychrobacter immobilis]